MAVGNRRIVISIRPPHSLWNTNIKFHSAHERCKRLWGKAALHPCITCGGPANEWAYDGTDDSELYSPNQHGYWNLYSRFPEFYMPMCRKCHARRDGAIARQQLHEYRLARIAERRKNLNEGE